MIRFVGCTVDLPARVIRRDGDSQHLEPQAFDLLAYLISHSERVVPKSELLDEVWGDQFVSESALTTRIKEVRQAVGDDGKRQSVIKNFRGRGYRFVAELEAESVTGEQPTPTPMATSLVGRDDELDTTASLLAESRLVTLVGPGGVGKTTLATEVARRVRDRHADGVRLIGLALARDPASVIHVFRRDSGLTDVGSDDDALIDALADLDTLYVVDNCEHVLAEATRVVAAIIAAGGRARVLATSRERLGVSSERVLPVNPLDRNSARELLLARARSAQPDYAWSPDDDASIDRLVEAVDRLPLAIEMAAARLPTIGPADLERVLATEVGLLRSADRNAEDRHGTVDALVAWSEDLLAPDEYELLADLTCFAGPVALSDISAVVGVDDARLAVGPLASLVDKSLVVAHTGRPPTRYRVLETVRARASRRRTHESEARHAAHIAGVVGRCDTELRTPDEATAAARLDGVADEIRAAHEWARREDPPIATEITAALLHPAYERQWTEPARWAGELGHALAPDDPGNLAVAASLAADASNRADYAAAGRLGALAATSTDHRVMASALITLADLGIYTGDVAASRQHTRALKDLGESIGDVALHTLGVVGDTLAHVYGGEVDEGLRAFRRERPTMTGLGPTSRAWIAYTEGELHSASGRITEAIESFRLAVDLGSSVGSHFVVSVAQVSSLGAATRAADTTTSLAAFLPLLVHYRRNRSHTHAITTLRNLIEVAVRAGHTESAMVLLGVLSDPDVKSTYGSESDRLDSARLDAVEAVGESSVERWMQRGAAGDVAWGLDYAIDMLESIHARH